MTIFAIVWGCIDGAFLAAWMTIGMRAPSHRVANAGDRAADPENSTPHEGCSAA